MGLRRLPCEAPEFVDSILTGIDSTSSPFRDAVKTMEVAEMVLAGSLLSARGPEMTTSDAWSRSRGQP